MKMLTHKRNVSEGRKGRSGEEENSGQAVPGFDSVKCFHFCVFLLMVLVSGPLSRPFSLHGIQTGHFAGRASLGQTLQDALCQIRVKHQ